MKIRFEKLFSVFAFASALCLTPLSSHAQGYDYGPGVPGGFDPSKDVAPIISTIHFPHWFLTLSGGAEADIHFTNFVTNGAAIILPIAIPDIGPTNTFLIDSRNRSFGATHSPVVTGILEGGYNLNPDFSIFGAVQYSYAQGKNHVRFGEVINPFVDRRGDRYLFDLYGNFSNYNAGAGRVGAKYFFPETAIAFMMLPPDIRPFARATIGGRYVDSQKLQYFSTSLFRQMNTNLYNASWVFTTDFQLGVAWIINPFFNLGIQGGAGYDTAPERANRNNSNSFSGFFSGLNQGGARFYIPASLFLTFEF